MKLVENTKLFVDLTNIMVFHIMNNETGCFLSICFKRVQCCNIDEDLMTREQVKNIVRYAVSKNGFDEKICFVFAMRKEV